MPTSKQTPRQSNAGPYAINKRHSMPGHTSLMVEVRELFPDVIRHRYYSIEPVNEALEASEENYADRIEALITARKIAPGQAAIWRRVPSVRFGEITSNTEVALEFGKTLYSTNYSAGHTKRKPIVTCDLYCAFVAPDWSIYLRDGVGTSFPDHPLAQPQDALVVKSRKSKAAHLFGNIYPKGCALGEIAFDMAKMSDAVEEGAGATYAYDGLALPMIVTDDAEIYKTFRSQYAVLFLSADEGQSTWHCVELDRYLELTAR